MLITGVQTVLSDINASKYYADRTREFLGYLGCRNPERIPIRKMSRNDQWYDTAAGYANGTAIYLNEDVFVRNQSEGISLFTCAHEAAHHALGHPYQVQRNVLDIEREADETAARMLCNYGYRWVVRQEVDHLRRCVNAGQGGWTDGQHPTIQQRYAYLSRILERKDTVTRDKKASSDESSFYTNNSGKNNHHNEASHKGNSFKADIEEIKNLIRDLSNLSREQKIALAGIVGMAIIGCL
jgi:hypothetical protein